MGAWATATSLRVKEWDAARSDRETPGIIPARGQAVRLVFPSHADHVRMLRRLTRGLKDEHRATAGGDHNAVREADPLALVRTEELVADGPVCGLVFTPVGWSCRAISGGSPSARL